MLSSYPQTERPVARRHRGLVIAALYLFGEEVRIERQPCRDAAKTAWEIGVNTVRSFLGQLACVAALALVSAPAAWAGECPAASVKEGATQPGPSAPKGVTDTVISSIDLGQGYGIPGRALRARRLVIEPGGIVPWHGHGERPANIYVLEGQVTEFRSNCAVPIIHKKGEVVAEQGSIFHWWRNDGGRKAVLLSSDILPPAGKPEESM